MIWYINIFWYEYKYNVVFKGLGKMVFEVIFIIGYYKYVKCFLRIEEI